jgi:hypothetical protein
MQRRAWRTSWKRWWRHERAAATLTPALSRKREREQAMKHAVEQIHFVGTTAAQRMAFVMTAALAADADQGALS